MSGRLALLPVENRKKVDGLGLVHSELSAARGSGDRRNGREGSAVAFESSSLCLEGGERRRTIFVFGDLRYAVKFEKRGG